VRPKCAVSNAGVIYVLFLAASFSFLWEKTYRNNLNDKRKDREAQFPVNSESQIVMRFNQAAFGRQARTVRIVTSLPVRVQEKSKKINLIAPQRIYIDSTLIIIGMTATGEIVALIEPP